MTEGMNGLPVRRLRGVRQLTAVRLNDVDFSPHQPRRTFSEASIGELAESIARYGLLSPVIVRRSSGGRYELIAGARRLRALRKLGLDTADALILPPGDQDTALLALVENLHREPLGYFDEAEAYRAWLDEHHLSQQALSQRLLRSPSAVANKLRLLQLPPSVRDVLQRAGLSERHARALLRLRGEQRQTAAARQMAEGRLSVRESEALVRRMLTEPFAVPAVKPLCRDHRLFVNAMMDAVRTLQKSNARVVGRVEEHEEDVEIIVTIPR